ncbi:MAG: hypothetical protein AAF481_19250 [Acidobacteriota bacterium]
MFRKLSESKVLAVSAVLLLTLAGGGFALHAGQSPGAHPIDPDGPPGVGSTDPGPEPIDGCEAFPTVQETCDCYCKRCEATGDPEDCKRCESPPCFLG